MVGPRVGIVIPALNESASIEAVVRQSAAFGTPIVVDDGSSDGTGSIAAAIGAIVVKHEQNRGYDASLNSGFLKADELGVEFVITIDADGQHNPILIAKCLELLDAGADMVVGIRDKRQRFAENFFAYVTRALYGVHDPLCGFKGYRISIYRALGHFDSYASIGTELALFAMRNGYKLDQLPVNVRERLSKSRFGQGWAANSKILKAMVMGFMKNHARARQS
jgi:glycosyltransferase involved in cell wall biosynthesis